MIIDTHTHIYAEQFDNEQSEIVDRAIDAGVEKMIIPNEDENSLERVSKLCHTYKGVCFPLYGLHPTEVEADYEREIDAIFDFAEREGNMVGVGEIGLDLYWDKSKADLQAKAFARQIRYAIDHQLPMSMHIRDAYGLFFEVMKDFDSQEIVGSLHCYAGSTDDTHRILEAFPNVMFGFNGTSTYKKSTAPEQIALIPTERLLLETDAPYLAPTPYRGKRNEPSYICRVAEKMAEVKEMEVAEIEKITTENALKLFSLINKQ